MTTDKREYWQRGPVAGIPALLQPVAHALLQARAEVADMMNAFDEGLLWVKPANLASPAFHLEHLAGVVDRLFTYARGEQLSGEQRAQLALEGQQKNITSRELVLTFQNQVAAALEQLAKTPESSLLEPRGVGRARIPTTVLGLLFHSAEHTMRHVGQLLVTVRVLQRSEP